MLQYGTGSPLKMRQALPGFYLRLYLFKRASSMQAWAQFLRFRATAAAVRNGPQVCCPLAR